jgi:hypothetical protein
VLVENPPKLNVSIEPPPVREIEMAIKKLRNGKAAGMNELCAEILKVDPLSSAEILHPLFVQICMTGEYPNDWQHGLIVKIPKKET